MQTCNIKDYLNLVRKPSRYMGGEVNSIKKDISKAGLTFGLCFPDAYEVGMSHLGLQILYQILNSRDDIAAERAFAPWADMEALLRGRNMALSTIESGIPLSKLDVIGFSLQYELSYTNVLNMLELGGVTLLSSERGEGEPFVIGGGPVTFNPEPVAAFFDAFLLGDGEKAVLEIADCVKEGKGNGLDRKTILKNLAHIQGVYVPSLFEVKYNDDGTVREIAPLAEGYSKIEKRIEPDINSFPLPTRPVVPFMETIHDRVSVEIARGCTRGCRFCQAGIIYRPVRERRPEQIIRIIDETIRNTGYDEVSLLSLSTGDYSLIEELLTGLMSRFEKERVAVSLPSLRVGTLSANLANEIRKVRKTGFTLAPEAGSERLRQLINKGIKEEDLLAASDDIFRLGWNAMKLYFMLGLPTETDDDINEIARLADCVKKIGKKAAGRSPQINVAAATFIPKPHTPFQWEPQIEFDEVLRRQALLRKNLARTGLGFKWHEANMSVLEGVFSRGDRRLAGAILRAFRKGCRFDGWGDQFRFELWEEALKEEGLDAAFYIYRKRPYDEVFPWEHLNPGITKEFLIKEFKKAIELAYTPDCKVDRCSNCGVCDFKTVKNRTVEDDKVEAPAHESPHPAEAPYKLRLKFSKTGDARFVSHLELVNAMTRAIKRAGLPLLYSKGFHPLPRVTFTPPLPVGIESMEEYMDVELDSSVKKVAPAEAVRALNGVLPQGLRFAECTEVPLKLPLPSAIMTEYLVFPKNGPSGLNIEPDRFDGFVRDFLCKDSHIARIEKEGKATEIDLKPLIPEISFNGEHLRLVLRKGAGGNIRPHDAVAHLFGLSKEDASLIPILKTRTVQ